MTPLAASVWRDLLEVVVVGAVSGVGLAIAFAFLVRGVTLAGSARREGATGVWARNAALGLVSGVVCLAAVVFAVYEIVSG
jgi:NAD(P)-dependent dehydrogenase (short-subunit alcohol dehydrogenase family)